MDTKSTIIDLSKIAIDENGNILASDQVVKQLKEAYASSVDAPQSTNRLNCANTGCDNSTNRLSCTNRLRCDDSNNSLRCEFDSPHR